MSTNPADPIPHKPEVALRTPSHTSSPVPGTSVWWTVGGWLFVAVLAVGAWHYQARWLPLLDPILARAKPPAPKPPRVVPVSIATVRQRDMPIYLNGLGTVTAFKTVTVRSRVEGELIKIGFSEGEIVQKGDLLAEIDPRAFEVQLAQAEGQLARDQAILKTARLTLSRYEGLLASKSIAAQQVDDQATLVQQTMASVQTDEATIENAKLLLTYCRIEAPITGRIGLRLVDQGNIIRANDPTGLAVITQLQPIALIFTVPQDDISRVQRRSNAGLPLQVVAFDRDFKQELATGQLLAIDNQVDATTGTVRLKAEFTNEDGMLFPNQFVNARLLVDTKRDAIVVPSAAVQRGPTSMYVYVVKEDETVELRNVVPGPSEGAETSIESGLSPGEIVVTDGLDKLQPKAKVSPRDKENPGKGERKSSPEGGTGKPPKSENGTDDKARRPGAGSSSGSETHPATAEQHPGKPLPDKESGTNAESKPKTVPSCDDPELDASSESDGKGAQ